MIRYIRCNKSVGVLVLILALAGCGSSGGGGNSAAAPSAPVYAPAPKGTPTGTAVTQTIDANGGSVTSADGRLALTIPAGALPAATPITIQPITSTSPNGVGLGYRLTPEGTTFTTPVTVAFHLNSIQALGLDSTFIVSQHADGLWYSQPHQTRDATAQTISVSAKHFSDWTLAKTVRLTPQETRVKVGQKANFNATIVVAKSLDNGDDELANPFADELAVPVEEDLNNQIKGTHSWQVNGVDGGTDTFGHVTDSNMTGNYTAPNATPNPSDVAVSVTVTLGTTKVIAPAKVTVYAQETWNGTSHVTYADGTVIDSTFTFAQTSDDGHGKLTFNVQSGNVHAVVPATLPNGCTQTATPTDYAIGAGDGMMTATYDLTTGPDSPMVAGMGTTVWLANYITNCPNGSGTMQNVIQAQWWPVMLGSAPTPIEAFGGVYDNTISANGVTGIVHLTRQ